MTRTAVPLVLVFLLALLAASPAPAMPAGEGGQAAPEGGSAEGEFFERVVETRRTAGERYQAMREERIEKLNRTAAQGAGRGDRVPGWKLAGKPESAPVDDPTDTKGLYILLIVGAGVVLSLLLRVFAPFLYDRRPRHARTGGPMTIQLKPREERNLRRGQARHF